MKTYRDETGTTVKAANYLDAAEKLYGQEKNPDNSNTTYCHKHLGYADVSVYEKTDKIGTYYGVQAATPIKHKLVRI